MTDTKNPMLIARAEAEQQWLEKVKEISADNFVAIPWLQDASIQGIGSITDWAEYPSGAFIRLYKKGRLVYMDKKTYELIAIGASIAANCQSWLEYHVGAAREAGAVMDELKTAVEIGEMVRQKPKEHMDVMVSRIMGETNTEEVQVENCNSGRGWGP